MTDIALRRRDFLRGGKPRKTRICPPGVTLSDLEACSGCAKCVEVCPQKIITLADGLPTLDFSVGECTFCGECAEHCPEPVFQHQKISRFDHIVTIGDDCLAFGSVDCQACRDACPEQAIRFHPRRGGPFTPTLQEDMCTGCGACVSVCPVEVIQIKALKMEMRYASV